MLSLTFYSFFRINTHKNHPISLISSIWSRELLRTRDWVLRRHAAFCHVLHVNRVQLCVALVHLLLGHCYDLCDHCLVLLFAHRTHWVQDLDQQHLLGFLSLLWWQVFQECMVGLLGLVWAIFISRKVICWLYVLHFSVNAFGTTVLFIAMIMPLLLMAFSLVIFERVDPALKTYLRTTIPSCILNYLLSLGRARR